MFSPNIGAQLLESELIDEIDLHVTPILLGDGDPASAVRVRYRPTTSTKD